MYTPHDRSADYRTPVRRESASVTFINGERHDVVLFCALGDDIGRLLEESEPFLPVEQDGKVRLVARKTIAVVTTKPRDDAEEEGTLTRRVTVAVHLRGGAAVEGELAYTPRPARPRVLDYLNEPGVTLRVITDQVVHHVSKEHIDSVEER